MVSLGIYIPVIYIRHPDITLSWRRAARILRSRIEQVVRGHAFLLTNLTLRVSRSENPQPLRLAPRAQLHNVAGSTVPPHLLRSSGLLPASILDDHSSGPVWAIDPSADLRSTLPFAAHSSL